MRASQFVSTFHDKLPDAFDWSRRPSGAALYMGADWTAWVTQRLHEVARAHEMSCCCSGASHQPAFDPCRPGETRGARREYLFDLTWYSTWQTYRQPDVLVEHENTYGWEPFLADHWKLMVGWAPLRVSFGYARRAAELHEYAQHLNDVAAQRGWTFPQGCEDLTLLGHYGMAPRGYRVLHRGSDALRWTDLGSMDRAAESLR